MNLNTYRLLISENKIEKVIKKLKTDIRSNSDKYSDLIVIEALYNDVEKDLKRNEEQFIYSSRIRKNLLSLINSLVESDINSTVSRQKNTIVKINNAEFIKLKQFVTEHNYMMLTELKKINEKIDSIIKFNFNDSNTYDNIEEFIDNCYRLISFDEIKELFLILKNYFMEDKSMFHQIIILHNRWIKNEKMNRLGQINIDIYARENNNVIKALLDIIETLK